jgi:hypothetical protein
MIRVESLTGTTVHVNPNHVVAVIEHEKWFVISFSDGSYQRVSIDCGKRFLGELYAKDVQ